MHQRHFDFPHLVGEREEDTVLTLAHSERELVTELGPVLDGAVELFHVVVAENAVVALGTVLALFNPFADLAGVVTTFSPSIIFVVVEHAVFVVVSLFLPAHFRLEQLKVQFHHFSLPFFLFFLSKFQNLLIDLFTVQFLFLLHFIYFYKYSPFFFFIYSYLFDPIQ